MTDPRFTRRAFLTVAGGAGATLLAACLRLAPSSSAAPGGASTSAATPSAPPTLAPTPAEVPLRAKIAQMLLVGFRGTDAASASAILADISERGLGGVVLFSVDQPSGSSVRNIVSPGQLAALTATLQDAGARPTSDPGRHPLLIAVDQEGGQVARLGPDHGFPPTVSAAQLGAQEDPRATRQAGRDIARTLRDAGINLNLAPVVDLDLNPANPIIGALDRSFGADPALVQRQAAAFIDGHREIGVWTTLKHFPGHGSATGDTHLGVVDVTDTWQPIELQPFRELIADGHAQAILTAHVFNARLDPQHPATLSRATITGILRRQLGWRGVVISDDMQMGAIRDAYGYADALRLAILAGVDILTIANQPVFEEGIVGETIELVAGMVKDGSIPERRITESWLRITALRRAIATGEALG
ncbi:MAG TPA: glycoside hydrolase family 3 N-terminal domain-containing protein [Candidatus Limnocylindria bacterium]|nr:glycoside hydrolase family 3 N-terminal domain-containing protein [Candidatus Limnocylindria bacterium]